MVGKAGDDPRLGIVHVFRSPVGGLFRHVLDLAREQAERGHAVGLIADASTGGGRAEALLGALAPRLALGITRIPMHRDPHPSDALAMARVATVLRRLRPDVVHGHGAKGALYARLPGLLPFAPARPARFCTPHGGSLHYDPASLKGRAVLGLERLLSRGCDAILFESRYALDRFRAAAGAPACPTLVVHNGLEASEFAPVAANADAADILFVGEMRRLKGVDVLLRALAKTAAEAPLTAVLVGDGPDRAEFEALAAELGLGARVRFAGPMPARAAFALGRLLVVPSRAESLPYIVMEAAAARVPLLASRVGGIAEILGEEAGGLVPPDDPDALAAAIARHRRALPSLRDAATAALAARVERQFSSRRMADTILRAYHDALAPRSGVPALSPTSPRFGL